MYVHSRQAKDQKYEKPFVFVLYKEVFHLQYKKSVSNS